MWYTTHLDPSSTYPSSSQSLTPSLTPYSALRKSTPTPLYFLLIPPVCYFHQDRALPKVGKITNFPPTSERKCPQGCQKDVISGVFRGISITTNICLCVNKFLIGSPILDDTSSLFDRIYLYCIFFHPIFFLLFLETMWHWAYINEVI